MATTAERLKAMGLYDRYQKVRSGEIKTSYTPPTTTTTKKRRTTTQVATQPTTKEVLEQQIADTMKEIQEKQSVLQTATTAGYGIGTGKDIPADILAGEPAIVPIIPEEVPVEEGYSAIMGAGGVGTMMQAIQDQYEKDRELSMKQYEDSKGIIQKYLDKRKSSEAILAEQQEKWGLSESFQQIKDITALTLPLQQQIADITIQETAEIDRASQMGMSEGWLRRKETEIHNKYNKLKAPIATQLNAYAAQAQTLQGNLGMANQFANQAVQAATYDQEFEYNTIKAFMDLNNDFLQSLKADQRFYFTNALDIAKSNFDLARSDKSSVMNLMLQYPNAGITINDTIDSATSKASGWAGTQPITTDVPTGGVAVFADDEGNQYDLGTIEGLNQFKVAHPDYTYADMNAFLDQNIKGMDASTRKQLLDGSDFKEEEMERAYDTSFYKTAVRKSLKSDYKRNVSEFIIAMKDNFKDLTNKDIEMLKEFYITEQNVVNKLSWLARIKYFKD